MWGNHETGRRTLLRATLLLPLAGCTAAPAGSPSSGPPAPGASPPHFALLERRFDARLGVYALDTGSGREIVHRADERFAMLSTFKTLAAAAVLDRTPPEHLDDLVRFTSADLLEYAPIAEQQVDTGMTIRDLCEAAIRYSDNTAANLLLADLGGPQEVTAFARELGDTVTRLDRTEPDLNTAVPGDERDTSSPRAIAGLYRELVLGERLDPADRELLTGWLVGNTTGGEEIRAGLPGTWRVGDKTGSGAFGTANDVAVAWPPDRAPIVLATMSTRPAQDADADPALLAAAAREVAAALA
ncbi:class A beta-lactamase [Pseudonocardia sp.]|uniref:class A beta-lactamase n=1 Tax=Pseudonocardia sp. TaxID=60912 RepID=UPI00260F1477|nr:class A beta-lactamase [Pseudonocardia sp.]